MSRSLPWVRRLLPRTFAGQTVLLLVVGLSLSHALTVVFHQYDRGMLLAATGGNEFAHRVAAAVRSLDAVPPEIRPAVIQAVQAADLRLRLNDGPPDGREETPEEADWRADYVRRLVVDALKGWPLIDASRVDLRATPSGAQMIAHVPVGDGAWLRAEGALVAEDAPASLSMDIVVSTLIMFVAVLVAAIWAARRLARPLRHMALAADRLGRDVTAPPLPEEGPEEVRRAAEAFNRMQSRLRRLVEDRMQMLAAISHDLRTPITLLRLRAEFIPDKTEQAKTLQTLDEMAEMVNSLLAFAREEAAEEEIRVVDLAALVDTVCADLADTGAKVTFRPADPLPMSCRVSAVRRAVTNLVSNAVRHGGEASVAMETTPDQVRIIVEDEGPGIPEGELEQVFRPFYRVERSRNRDTGGVGLGLAVVRSVARQHGGDAFVENRPDGGLRAVVTLPLTPPSAAGDTL